MTVVHKAWRGNCAIHALSLAAKGRPKIHTLTELSSAPRSG
jgi:hypothetical protein